MDDLRTAPVLSTPADSILEPVVSVNGSQQLLLSVEQFDLRYEVRKTVDEIRARRWKRIALQFPDSMLVDSPRVFDRLSTLLGESRRHAHHMVPPSNNEPMKESDQDRHGSATADNPELLSILGDTSYGACCVDEIAAEHASADGIVHYGRSCLSPSQRLPVIYVFTSRSLEQDAVMGTLYSAFPDKASKICLLADVPWQHHILPIADMLRAQGYMNVLAPELVHDPSSPIPNRAITTEELGLKDYSIFHISTPPTALVLALLSRVKQLYVYDPASSSVSTSVETTAPAILRRRYATLLRLSSASVIGILINTLSVKNYMAALEHVQSLITAAGKKFYTFVVGKLNPAKLANFAEVDGWVVIGCWESSLIDSKEFLAPIITPFELEIAMMSDDSRTWGQEWISDFQTLLQRKSAPDSVEAHAAPGRRDATLESLDDSEDDEPPEFDLRTGRYVSRPRQSRKQKVLTSADADGERTTPKASSSSALVSRAKGDIAIINGVASPGAEYLRSKRDWQGLGSDFNVEYDRDAQGNIQGATMEEGRSGVAKGYTHGQVETRT